MKRLFLIFGLALALGGYTQNRNDIEYFMSDTSFTCQDINAHAEVLIPKYYEYSLLDSINDVIWFWEESCGVTEQTIRLKILLAIEQNRFAESVYDTNIIKDLLYYKSKATCTSFCFLFEGEFYTPDQNNIDEITLKWAKRLDSIPDKSPIEDFFLKIYSHQFDNQFSRLSTETFDGTLLQKCYLKEIKKNSYTVNGNIHFGLGAWIPTGNLKLLGGTPNLSVQMDINYKKWLFAGNFQMRFGRSSEVLQVYKSDSLWDCDKFLGGYLGMHSGYHLIKTRSNKFALTAGIGWDFSNFTLKESTEEDSTYIARTLHSLNLNAGFSYKYYIDDWQFIGINGRFHFLFYRNRKGTNLSGNAITIGLIYGLVPYDAKRQNLINLEYYE